MKAMDTEITANLTGTVFLEVGNVVKDQNGEEGEVLGFSSNGDPVVMFDSGERTINLSKETLHKKSAVWRLGSYSRPKHITRIPLDQAVKIGFSKVFGDRYEYREDYGTKTAEKYPWDHGSIWKVSEGEDGKKYLVKEESDKAGQPEDHYTKHQLDNTDGEPAGVGNAEDTFNIFD